MVWSADDGGEQNPWTYSAISLYWLNFSMILAGSLDFKVQNFIDLVKALCVENNISTQNRIPTPTYYFVRAFQDCDYLIACSQSSQSEWNESATIIEKFNYWLRFLRIMVLKVYRYFCILLSLKNGLPAFCDSMFLGHPAVFSCFDDFYLKYNFFIL